MKNRQQHLLAACAIALSFFAQASRGADATINWTDVKQEIDGFGAGGYYHASDDMIMGLSDAVRKDLFDFLFDSTLGIGMSTLRSMTPEDHEPSPGIWNWTVGAKFVTIMQEAQKRGVKKIWLAPWTPPLWMKTENSRSAGSLAPARYQDYADYMSRVVREYKSRHGLDIWAYSVQNEPHFNPSWDGCYYSPENIRDFIKNNMGPTFKRDSLKTKILMAETNFNQQEWPNAVLNDATAASYTDVVAFHVYENCWPVAYPLGAQKGKRLWETETCFTNGVDDGWPLATHFSHQIHDAMTIAGCNAWHYWLTAYSDEMAVVRISGGNIIKTKWAYFFGHYSKFVRPGWNMIGVSPYAQPGNNGNLEISAYKNKTTGEFAIVALHTGIGIPGPTVTFHLQGFSPTKVTPYLTDGSSTSINLQKQADIAVTNGTFTYTIPNVSIATFVGKGTPAPVSASVLTPPAAKSAVALYANRGLSLKLARRTAYAVRLTNAIGRTVGAWSGVGSGNVTLDCGGLAPGIYRATVVAGPDGSTTNILVP